MKKANKLACPSTQEARIHKYKGSCIYSYRHRTICSVNGRWFKSYRAAQIFITKKLNSNPEDCI